MRRQRRLFVFDNVSTFIRRHWDDDAAPQNRALTAGK
jgi:hypothetical protein